VRYTSASVIHSDATSMRDCSGHRSHNRTGIPSKTPLAFCATLLSLLLSCSVLDAESLDRVVAYVDYVALTLTELEANYQLMREKHHDITREEVIDSMINRVLMLREARKMKLEASTDDELLKEYMEIKVRSLVTVKDEAVRSYYADHLDEFPGRSYSEVRDEIDVYLFEKETNRLLKEHLRELRGQADISVRLQD
jgi:hypothetical protein